MIPPHDGSGVTPRDPYAVLGVSREATTDQVREAYLKKVKEFPPDRSPEQFEQIRDAYDLLRNPAARAANLIHGTDPATPLTDLIPPPGAQRKFVDFGFWLAVLKS